MQRRTDAEILIERQTDAEIRINGQTDTEIRINRQTDTVIRINRQKNRQTDTEIQINRQTGTEIQIDRQTDNHSPHLWGICSTVRRDIPWFSLLGCIPWCEWPRHGWEDSRIKVWRREGGGRGKREREREREREIKGMSRLGEIRKNRNEKRKDDGQNLPLTGSLASFTKVFTAKRAKSGCVLA